MTTSTSSPPAVQAGGPGAATPEPKSVAERLAEGRSGAAPSADYDERPYTRKQFDAIAASTGTTHGWLLVRLLEAVDLIAGAFLDRHKGRCDCALCLDGRYTGCILDTVASTRWHAEMAASALESELIHDRRPAAGTWADNLRQLAEEADAVEKQYAEEAADAVVEGADHA